MDHLTKLTATLKLYALAYTLINAIFLLSGYVLLEHAVGMDAFLALMIALPVSLITSYWAAAALSRVLTGPLKAVWQSVWHLSPGSERVAAPSLETISHGREAASSLVKQIYSLASPSQTPVAAVADAAPAVLNQTESDLLSALPLPVIALDSGQRIVFTNQIAADYFSVSAEELAGKYLPDVFRFSFATPNTLESWLEESKTSKAIASSSWDRVRMQLPDDKGVRQLDLIAHYIRDNPSGYETLLALFDHTDKYNADDNSTAYVALAVHELRTPLTLLRGYIEVFEEELDGQFTPELRDFMHKMSASAQTLTAFVSNILNVARVDENQLSLSLHEADWNELLPQICKDLELRVKVRGKTLEQDIAPNLPKVAVDKISIYEVVSNLVENAVKYSGEGTKIVIHAALGKDGRVETVVQDFGVGIPESSIKYLFTKFYRSHRSKGKVGGSGLGLYLVKAIVEAHGGAVWVQSHEGQGSSFGFSLQPFSTISEELKDQNGGGIVREAHGWIKNHSMYRK